MIRRNRYTVAIKHLGGAKLIKNIDTLTLIGTLRIKCTLRFFIIIKKATPKYLVAFRHILYHIKWKDIVLNVRYLH